MRYTLTPLPMIRPSGGVVPATMVLVQRKYPPKINMKGAKGVVRMKILSGSRGPGDYNKTHGQVMCLRLYVCIM